MKRFFLFIFTCLISLGTYSQITLKSFLDLVDWSKTETEFIEQWSDNVIKVEHFHNTSGKWTKDYEVSNILFGETTISMIVGVSDDTHSLYMLKAVLPVDADNMKSLENAERILANIYGKPDIVEDNLNSTVIQTKEQRWYRGNYELELYFSVLSSYTTLSITAKQHDNEKTDIRVAKWGDSKKDIINKEGKDNLSTNPDVYMFEDKIAGFPCIVGYVFVDDKLTMLKYILTQKHSNSNDFIDDYNKLVDLLSKKYGEPYFNMPTWKNTLFKNEPSSYGLAISAGHLEYNAAWDLPKEKIDVFLDGENYDINFVIQYVSKQYQNAKKEKQEKDALEML